MKRRKWTWILVIGATTATLAAGSWRMWRPNAADGGGSGEAPLLHELKAVPGSLVDMIGPDWDGPPASESASKAACNDLVGRWRLPQPPAGDEAWCPQDTTTSGNYKGVLYVPGGIDATVRSSTYIIDHGGIALWVSDQVDRKMRTAPPRPPYGPFYVPVKIGTADGEVVRINQLRYSVLWTPTVSGRAVMVNLIGGGRTPDALLALARSAQRAPA